MQVTERLAERDQQLTERERDLAERDRQLGEQQVELNHYKAETTKLQAELTNRQAEVTALQTEVSTLQSEIRQLVAKQFERESAGERDPPAAGSSQSGKKESVAKLKEELVAAVGARRDAERRLELKDLPNRRRLEVRRETGVGRLAERENVKDGLWQKY